MKLFGYWRSSASYRVRILLNLKGVNCERHAVHLVRGGGEQHSEAYQRLNPNRLVPALEDNGLILNQSLAIMEYLEELYPKPALLPVDPKQKAVIRALCYDIACDAAPMNNLRVVNYLSNELGVSDDNRMAYIFHWLGLTFDALEDRATSLLGSTGKFLFHDKLTMADVVLIPQIYNARRFNYEMSKHPLLNAIWFHCNSIDAFVDALPENQADAV
jgi:maleylacetoacetate isomerase